MNTDGLAKHCALLTPWERLPLILAASARGDGQERSRLATSAPRVAYQLQDYFGLADGLQAAAMLQQMELLQLAAVYWQADGALQQEITLGAAGDKTVRARFAALSGVLAYALTVKVDGWKRFCAEVNVEADLLLKALPGYEVVRRAEAAARVAAFTPEGVADWMRKRRDGAPVPLTPEVEAAEIRRVVNARAERWG
jgi:hypothetical protein